jgi:hypothetical protein
MSFLERDLKKVLECDIVCDIIHDRKGTRHG